VSNPTEPGSPDPGEPTQGTPPYGQPTPPPPPPPYGQPPPPPPPPQWGQAPPQYGQPQYGQPQYGGYPVQRGTNGFAIASLVCAFLCSPLGVIFGFIAKSQIKQSGEGGDGLATAGIVLSIAFIVLGIILVAAGTTTFSTSTGP
jgi:Domain of unknown function (DUF4190)